MVACGCVSCLGGLLCCYLLLFWGCWFGGRVVGLFGGFEFDYAVCMTVCWF